MGDWVLILTLVAGTYSSGTVSQAGPFDTRGLCMMAADAWLSQRHASVRSKQALCVQRTLGKHSSESAR